MILAPYRLHMRNYRKDAIQIARILSKEPIVRSVTLLASVMRNEHKNRSDIDLAIELSARTTDAQKKIDQLVRDNGYNTSRGRPGRVHLVYTDHKTAPTFLRYFTGNRRTLFKKK